MEEAASGQEPQDQANGASSSLPPGGMGDWLAEHEQSVRQWRRGEVVEGVVVSADRDEFLVDIGAKSEAVVPLGEVPQTEVPSVGETVLARARVTIVFFDQETQRSTAPPAPYLDRLRARMPS